MTRHDDRVERVMRAMYESFGPIREESIGEVVTFDEFMTGPVTIVSDDDTYTFDRNRLEKMAVAAVAAMDAEPLEEVLDQASDLDTILIRRTDNGGSLRWQAEVDSYTDPSEVDGRYPEDGFGRTIDAAIRAAVASAKEAT